MRETRKTQKELIEDLKDLTQQLIQGIYGIPGTEEKGLLGDVKDLIQEVKTQNSRVKKNEQMIVKIWGVLIGAGTILGIVLGKNIELFLGG